MYFTEIVRNHQELKQTIARIEQTKQKIRNNEQSNIPLPEIALRQPFQISDAQYNSLGTLNKEQDISIKLIAFVKGLKSGQLRGEDMIINWNNLIVEMDTSYFTSKEENALERITEPIQQIATSSNTPKEMEISIIKQNIQKVLIPA